MGGVVGAASEGDADDDDVSVTRVGSINWTGGEGGCWFEVSVAPCCGVDSLVVAGSPPSSPAGSPNCIVVVVGDAMVVSETGGAGVLDVDVTSTGFWSTVAVADVTDSLEILVGAAVSFAWTGG